MDLTQGVAAVVLGLFLSVMLLHLLRAPLRLILRLGANTLLGFFALWIVQKTAAFSGISLGFNLWNALITGVLGVPGLALLLLAKWVL